MLPLLALFARPAFASAQPTPPLHTFESVAISPDGLRVVSLESNEPGPDAVKTPPATIAIRMLASGITSRIDCPAQTTAG